MVIIFKEDWSEVPSFLLHAGKNTLTDNESEGKTQRPTERDSWTRKKKERGCNPEESPSSLPYSLLPSHKYAESFSLRM